MRSAARDGVHVTDTPQFICPYDAFCSPIVSPQPLFPGARDPDPRPWPGMALWRESLLMSLSRNAARAMDFFRIPHNRVVESDTQVEL
jgi:hypothetical protein